MSVEQTTVGVVWCPFCPVLLRDGSRDTNDLMQRWLQVGEGNEIYQNDCMIAGIASCAPCAQAVIVDPEMSVWLVSEVSNG